MDSFDLEFYVLTTKKLCKRDGIFEKYKLHYRALKNLMEVVR